MARYVDLPLEHHGTLRVSLLPRSTQEGALLDLRDKPDRDRTVEPVQLIEGAEYRYEFILPDAPAEAVLTTDRDREIFEPDTADGRTGRLRPRLYTGTLPVTIFLAGQPIGRVAFEVRSWKFDYLSHYRWMLRDIADSLTEAVMERFAPTEQRFAPAEGRDALTLYQRFAFLRSLIQSEPFAAAIQQILARPHRAWVEEEEWRLPGQGLPAGSAVARQFSRPGGRTAWPGGPVPAVPARMQAFRTVETLDTAENRFVRFALTHWRDLVAEIDQALAAEPRSGPVDRGRREAADLLEYLDSLLSADLFREVGILTQLPAGSQVLQKRAGYRDLFRAFLQAEMAALLQWDGGEDVYSAGQRNVAALYEFWVFMQLSSVVAAFCSAQELDRNDLFEVREDGLGVRLKRGRQRLLTGVATRHGRRLKLELWFNRSFSAGEGGASWTRPMRPDCSLRIRLQTPEPEEIWLHFDAKYRVDGLHDLFGKRPQTPEEEEAFLAEEQGAEDAGTAKRSDLLKMHAYRDAIRQSAGAYVIYPGQERDDFKLYHEILPGLGAFALRPTKDGEAEGVGVLVKFLDDVLEHVASQATQHERDRYWRRISYGHESRVDRAVPAVPFLTRPPADTRVMLGYVKSQAHLDWIHAHHLYNLRADGRRGSLEPGALELGAEILVLYGPVLYRPEIWKITGGPQVITRTGMLELGYPDPGSEFYHGLVVQPIPSAQWPAGVSAERVRAVYESRRPGAAPGEPVAVTWLDLVR